MMNNILLFLSAFAYSANFVSAQCLGDPEKEEFFAREVNEVDALPIEGSCCQLDVCGLPCPAEVESPSAGFGIAIAIAIASSCIVGLLTYFVVAGQSVNFFVAGRSLPLFVVSMTLAAQSIDSNSILGNADLSYKYHFYDGAVLPIGLGFSLINNGMFLAHKINDDNVLTLPDVYAKRYGRVVEVLVSLITICSFLMLLAGNLVGMGAILSYVWGISSEGAIWLAATIVWGYTVTGGLFSVAYTDVMQGLIGWIGCMVCAFYLIKNEQEAAAPSIGFTGYVYPDDATCEMYEGVSCESDPSLCCYNAEMWCPTPENCTADNGAYPFGDKPAFKNQLFDHLALTPFPNAILWDWATIIILGFGNLAALDFQARCMAAKTPTTARLGCFIGGCLTFLIGIPFAYMGAITRVYYGPDSAHASFLADSCSAALGLPTCALWEPDPQAFIKLLTHEAPAGLGAWALIGIVCASMSTADGAILAMGTVFSHNVLRQFDDVMPDLVTDDNLLLMSRLATVPFALCATLIASYYQSDHPQGATGYLLIVAFDITLATVVAPLFGAFYMPKPSPNAALASIVVGATLRIALEFSLDKDGYLLLPFKDPEFQDVGPAASLNYPPFFDFEKDLLWDPTVEQCEGRQFADYTGVDSLSAFLASVVTYLLVSYMEKDVPICTMPGMTGYDKNLGEAPPSDEKEVDITKKEEWEDVSFVET